jgi:uncharacterized membrane protein
MNYLGARVFGVAAAIMGVLGLLWGEFAVDWMPPPVPLPGRMALAYAVGAALVAGGVLINIPRLAMWGAGILTAIFGIGVVVFDFTAAAMNPHHFFYFSASAEQLAVASGALIVFAATSSLSEPLKTNLERAGRVVFGLCLFSFGAAHFVYPEFTWPLVPDWLPPNQIFWAYATGVAHIAAGLGILSGVLSLLAARLLTVMYLIFQIFVHTEPLLSAPAKHGHWTEAVLNLALVGVAWIVADSLARKSNPA